MEAWVPLFEIFLNSPSPETEASLWLQEASASSSPSSTTAAPINGSSFISLLKKPCNVVNQSSSSSPTTKPFIFIQTLPSMVQSRILSFLAYEHQKFSSKDLLGLVREMLSRNEGIDFWVKRASQNLLDKMSESNYNWISHLSLDYLAEEKADEEFEAIPVWLKDAVVSSDDLVLDWLPVSHDYLDSRMSFGRREIDEVSMSQVGENMEEDREEVADGIVVGECTINVSLAPDVCELAADLRARVMTFELSTSKVVGLADEIRRLCLERSGNSFGVLGLVEPWNADDETASVLLSHLSNGIEEVEELGWPSQVLCSVVLPKFLVLEKPSSRVLMSATIEFCKLHQRAAEYALILPLALKAEGINNYTCEVITRVIKECLHLGQASAFCRKLLCGGSEERKCLYLPRHQQLISDKLVWNESLFGLFQNILNLNVHLTQDSVDHLVLRVRESAERFYGSLKFGNLLLHFVTKCSPMLRAHKLLLIEAAGCTNTLVTKSILLKLAGL